MVLSHTLKGTLESPDGTVPSGICLVRTLVSCTVNNFLLNMERGWPFNENLTAINNTKCVR